MPGRRRFFHHLLVTALHGAVALTEVDDVAMRIRQHLELDVARLLQELLHVDLFVAERRAGFRLRDGDGIEQRRFRVHHAHAAATAAAGRLDDHGVADFAGDAQVLVSVRAERAVGAGHAGHAVRLHHLDGRHLVAHHANGLGLGADEHEAALLDALREVRVLREEAVARVDAHRVRDFRGADDRRHVEVAQRRRRRPDADGLVREQHVLQAVIGGRVHGSRADAEFAARAQDSQRDLATIGDDDLLEHGHLFDYEQRLAELNGVAVAGHDRGDAAGLVRLDLIHHLHRFDDAERLADLHFVADLDERLRARRGRGIEGADHRGRHHVLVGARAGGGRFDGGRCRRCGRRGGRDGRGHRHRVGRHPVQRRGARGHAADANGFLAFFDFDLRNARLLEQLDQFLDFTDVHARRSPQDS